MESNSEGRASLAGTEVLPQILCPRIRAVIADDNSDMLAIMSWILERGGRVDVVGAAPNGERALRLVRLLDPELVILDVNMPGMSGFEAAMHIKRTRPGTGILIVSSDDDPDLAVAALDCGADDFLWKGSLSSGCEAALARLFPPCESTQSYAGIEDAAARGRQ